CDTLPEIAGLGMAGQRAIGARPVVEDPADGLPLLAAAQLVHDVVDELQQLPGQVAERHLDLLAEVDELAVDPPPAGPPLVLQDEPSPVDPEAEVSGPQLVEFGEDRLDGGGQWRRLVDPHGVDELDD